MKQTSDYAISYHKPHYLERSFDIQEELAIENKGSQHL